jgi:hypothetical protein
MRKEIYQIYRPDRRSPKSTTARNRFGALNSCIGDAGGWLTSIPGKPEMRFDVLPDSPLPAALRDLGYIVERTAETQRILPHAVTERFETSSPGALVTATGNSTKPVTHAGIATLEQSNMRMP